MGIVFPCHLLPQWGLMEISMVLEAICVVGDYLCMTHPLNFHIWISEGQDQSAVSRRGQLTCLKVKVIFHIWENMCFWRSRLVIWPPCLNSFYSFILIWNLEESHQICAGWFGKYILTKLILKVNGKMCEIQLKNTVFYGHRDYMEMKGDVMVIQPCDMQCHVFCEMCMLFKDVLMWINAVSNVIQWFLSVTLINPIYWYDIS